MNNAIAHVDLALLFYASVVTFMLLHKIKQARITDSIANKGIEKLTRDKAETIQKLVPQQFVQHLQIDKTGALALGQTVEEEVAILFCDIKGFTGLSEQLQPNELIRFLNSYFLRMNGPIRRNNGFIDKFIGDAIMALFDHPGGSALEKAQDSINAAIAMQKAVAYYNSHRLNAGYKPISVAIGVHFGTVTMGTVGSEERMDTTVIGDNVNVAAALESIAPLYAADIVISEEAVMAAGDNFHCEMRLLDFVRIKGRKKPVKIFEVLAHLTPSARARRGSTQKLIRRGLKYRFEKQWANALSLFDQALALTPDDAVIKHHIDTCRRCQKMTLPGDWDGAIKSVV